MTTTESTEISVQDLEDTRAIKEQHDKVVSWTLENFRNIKNARVSIERQWYLNLAFFFGKQNVQVVRAQTGGVNGSLSTKLWVPPAPYYRSRPVINRIRPTIRTELAQLTNNKPNATVIPASAEDRDMYAAAAGEQIWNNLYTTEKVKAVLRRALWWTLICGTGYIKNYWDVPGDKIKFDPVGAFHVYVPDLLEEEIENQPFLIHAKTITPDQARLLYGGSKALDGSDLFSNYTVDSSEIMEESFLNLIGSQTMTKKKSVLVLEVYVKPGCVTMFPKGAFFTVVGNKIMQGQGRLPYSHGQYPFAKFDHIPAGKYYSTSSVEDLVPLQKEYNRTRGQIIEAKNRTAKPQLIAPRGSIQASQITTEPGQVILYTPGFNPPQPLPLQALPNYVLQEIDRILQDWNDISGQHEVTHGNVPPGVTAATAISYLQERDESKLSPTYDSLEEGIEKIANMSLVYVKDYWTEERTVKVTGPEGSFDALVFKGSDLGNNIDVRIEAGSALPVSKAAKQALIMDLMKLGFIDPNKGLQVMDMGGINKIYEQIQVDQRQAQRENMRMSKVTKELLEQYNQQNMQIMTENPEHFEGLEPPLLVPVNSYDNHKLHIEYHNQFRKGQSFEILPSETKALFEAHVNQHIMALGIESVTMDPRAAAGLPPLPPGEEGQGSPEQGSMPPGPQPMPQMDGGM